MLLRPLASRVRAIWSLTRAKFHCPSTQSRSRSSAPDSHSRQMQKVPASKPSVLHWVSLLRGFEILFRILLVDVQPTLAGGRATFLHLDAPLGKALYESLLHEQEQNQNGQDDHHARGADQAPFHVAIALGYEDGEADSGGLGVLVV